MNRDAGTRKRHVPQRSCVICRTKTSKGELVRVVLTPDGECAVDETGKQAGRGAYLCRREQCWERALSTGRLANALRGELRDADRKRLAAYAAATIKAPEPVV